MNRKRALLIGFLFLILGLIIGNYIGNSSRVEIREIEVISLEQNMLMYAEILGTYYEIETEEKEMKQTFQTNIKLEILELNQFVNWLKVNGYEKCYYEYYKPKISIYTEEFAIFWVWHDSVYYYWELEK